MTKGGGDGTDPRIPVLFEGTPPPGRGSNTLTVVEARFEQHSGPLPDAKTLAGYEKLHPGATKQFLDALDRQQLHRIEMERSAMQAEIDDKRSKSKARDRGQYMGVLVAAAGMAASFVLGLKGYEKAAAMFIAEVVALVALFLGAKWIDSRKPPEP